MEWTYIAVIAASVVAVILNFVNLRKDTVNYGNPTRSQLANMSSILFTTITGIIFTYTVLVDDDFLTAGYVFGSVSVLTNLFSLVYHLELIKNV